MSRFITRLAYAGTKYVPTMMFSDGETYGPLGRTISLSFDVSQRYCIGWHDLKSGESYPCPEGAVTSKKFETCPACQRRTGFNPAFYHADKISEKQEARNAEPHNLYLAYMGKDYIKVGISWEKRGIKRLLDQGARAGLIVDTFPTALIARQYESKIARLDGLHETTPTRTKLNLLTHEFDKKQAKAQLIDTKQRINQSLSTTFSNNDVLYFDKFYTRSIVSSGAITTMTGQIISGKVVALVGDILITNYEGQTLALPLKQFIGYPVELSENIIPLDLDPQQMQLF